MRERCTEGDGISKWVGKLKEVTLFPAAEGHIAWNLIPLIRSSL